MQEHTEKHLDKLTEKLMKHSSLEQPSINFTANVMSRLELASEKSAIAYKPPISKTGWFVIIGILIAISAYVMFAGEGSSSLWSDKVDLSVLTNNKVADTISSITFSKIMVYAIALFGLAWFIQVPMMKYYLDKRLEF